MIINQNSLKPIYIQVAEGIEDDILHQILVEDQPAYSQYQIAKQFQLNPATAAKGINLLVAEGILYKKRGLGMFVSVGAKEMIIMKRKQHFFTGMLQELMKEAAKLNIDIEELKRMIDLYQEEGNS